ncbi:MAG: hypothetical protein AVDCRST_MAG29-2522, partial [uncultured Nocardioidaceae bacterium]
AFPASAPGHRRAAGTRPRRPLRVHAAHRARTL